MSTKGIGTNCLSSPSKLYSPVVLPGSSVVIWCFMEGYFQLSEGFCEYLFSSRLLFDFALDHRSESQYTVGKWVKKIWLKKVALKKF